MIWKFRVVVAWMLLCLIRVDSASASEKTGPPSHAVVLQYHHFGSTNPAATSVTVSQFEQHLQYLQDHGFTVWPLAAIVDSLQSGGELPDRCVAITIDDAYRSVFEIAFPRLQTMGWPMTVFVATAGVDQDFPSYLTWDEMRLMVASGVHFAPHGHTHDHLVWSRPDESAEQWEARVRQDITTCIRRLQDELGDCPSLFAYPYGEHDHRLRMVVQQMGLVGFGQQSGPVGCESDFTALPRFPMAARFADLDEFRVKVNSLPLPVLRVDPVDPILSDEQLVPSLRLWLAPGDYRADELVAYASGQGRISLTWIDRNNHVLELQATQPVPLGRSRYNLTAPALQDQRYYWYSHLWIRGRTSD